MIGFVDPCISFTALSYPALLSALLHPHPHRVPIAAGAGMRDDDKKRILRQLRDDFASMAEFQRDFAAELDEAIAEFEKTEPSASCTDRDPSPDTILEQLREKFGLRSATEGPPSPSDTEAIRAARARLTEAEETIRSTMEKATSDMNDMAERMRRLQENVLADAESLEESASRLTAQMAKRPRKDWSS